MTIDNLFGSVLGTGTTSSVTPTAFFLCLAVSLLLGGLLALFHRVGHHGSRSFLVTLAILPAVVCVVIMLVNGNLGAGVAVAGAFSLVRFRSVPGTAREIGALFLAMAAGLATGMGYLSYALLFTLGIGGISLLYERLGASRHATPGERIVRITLPEDLDYGSLFDDIWNTYTRSHRLLQVKTTHLGSLFRLTYAVTLQDGNREKEFLDALRCRNGNLEISCSLPETGETAL